MTIADIIANRKGNAGAWRIEDRRDSDWCDHDYELWHFGTRMLWWKESNLGEAYSPEWDLGHGSVSDQNGMNQAFRILHLPYYYSRNGGAHIVENEAMATVGLIKFRKRNGNYVRVEY